MCPVTFYNAYDPSPYCVKVMTSPKPFKDAKAYCAKIGGHLLEFESLEENVAVEKFIRKRNIRSWMGWVSFGLKKSKTV